MESSSACGRADLCLPSFGVVWHQLAGFLSQECPDQNRANWVAAIAGRVMRRSRGSRTWGPGDLERHEPAEGVAEQEDGVSARGGSLHGLGPFVGSGGGGDLCPCRQAAGTAAGEAHRHPLLLIRRPPACAASTYLDQVESFLDDANVSTHKISDQLGHAKVSMTQDRYLGRRITDRQTSEVLDGMFEDPEEDSDDSAGEDTEGKESQ